MIDDLAWHTGRDDPPRNYSLKGPTIDKFFFACNSLGTIAFGYNTVILPEIAVSTSTGPVPLSNFRGEDFVTPVTTAVGWSPCCQINSLMTTHCAFTISAWLRKSRLRTSLVELKTGKTAQQMCRCCCLNCLPRVHNALVRVCIRMVANELSTRRRPSGSRHTGTCCALWA